MRPCLHQAVLHILDADKDPKELSSKLVKRAKWVENAPASIIGTEYTMNGAVIALRDALDPSAAPKGACGINKAQRILEPGS